MINLHISLLKDKESFWNLNPEIRGNGYTDLQLGWSFQYVNILIGKLYMQKFHNPNIFDTKT